MLRTNKRIEIPVGKCIRVVRPLLLNLFHTWCAVRILIRPENIGLCYHSKMEQHMQYRLFFG